MKRVFLLILAIAVVLSLNAFASDKDAEWTWERDIEMVCMYDVGSGTDSTLRAICDQVGAELGVSIVINNVSGGSGLTGMEYFYTQPADGYTYGMLGVSHVLAGLKGTASFDVKNEMTAVSGLVQDNEMVFSNVSLPFSTWEGLVEYAKAHPGELTLSLTSINYTQKIMGELKNIMVLANCRNLSEITGEKIAKCR